MDSTEEDPTGGLSAKQLAFAQRKAGMQKRDKRDGLNAAAKASNAIDGLVLSGTPDEQMAKSQLIIGVVRWLNADPTRIYSIATPEALLNAAGTVATFSGASSDVAAAATRLANLIDNDATGTVEILNGLTSVIERIVQKAPGNNTALPIHLQDMADAPEGTYDWLRSDGHTEARYKAETLAGDLANLAGVRQGLDGIRSNASLLRQRLADLARVAAEGLPTATGANQDTADLRELIRALVAAPDGSNTTVVNWDGVTSRSLLSKINTIKTEQAAEDAAASSGS